MSEVEVMIKAVFKDKKANIQIGFPKNQQKMNARETSHLLASGISLLVKSCSKHDLGITDYELLKEIVKHLEDEFASISSYKDAEVNKNMLG